MPCSAVTLSLATIAAVLSVALIGIAFGTDNWVHVEVDRVAIQQELARGDGDPDIAAKFDGAALYRTRTKGLFRVCFPGSKPKDEELYLSPVETYCMNIDYYIPDEENLTKSFSEDALARLHMARSMIALFIVGFFFVLVAFLTGVVGCWRRSPGNITSTAILMLLACLFSAGAMGLWHGVEYYETHRLREEPYVQSWPRTLREHSRASYDWSYFVAWVGVGWALIASLLFSGASVCLRNERYHEEAKNMPYIMPVYPNKQQYPYGYSTYGYPGPYYHGSQYGPYNY